MMRIADQQMNRLTVSESTHMLESPEMRNNSGMAVSDSQSKYVNKVGSLCVNNFFFPLYTNTDSG